MELVRVAIVARDPALRMAAVSAFDDAPPAWEVRLCDDQPGDDEIVVTAGDVDVPGEIRFDPDDPSATIAAVAAATRRGRVYVVLGACGGSGATSLSLHLAARAAGRGCVVVECRHDRLLPELALRFSIEPPPRPTPVPVRGGFRAVFCDPPELSGVTGEMRRRWRRVIVDPGRAGIEAALAAKPSAVCCLVPPTMVGARRAAELIGRAPDLRWVIVLSRVGPGGEILRSEIARLIRRRPVCELPCSPGVRDAVDRQLVPGTHWSRWGRAAGRAWAALEAVA